VPPPTVESAMWELYLQYEADLKLKEPFIPLRELELKESQQPVPAQPAEPQQLTQHPMAIPGMPMLQFPVGVPKPATKLDPLAGAYIESVARADVFKMEMAVGRLQIPGPAGPQEGIKQEVLRQAWEEEK